MRRLSVFLFAFLLSLTANAAANFAKDRVIVRFNRSINFPEVRQALKPSFIKAKAALIPKLNIYVVKLEPGYGVERAVRYFNSQPSVVYAQADHKVTLRHIPGRMTPNDPEFSKQWSLLNAQSGADIRATKAWEITTGGKDALGSDIVVAVVDEGMDVAHKDLAENTWVNKGEIPGNGKDDDQNGYVDDINGWNAANNTGKIPAGMHATHVGGIMGAKGNNAHQVTGVNWDAHIMTVNALQGGNDTFTAIVLRAYGYVLAQKTLWLKSKGEKGANVVSTNSSFGVDKADCNSGEFPAWNDIYNEMGKVGILSAAATANGAWDVDQVGDVPTGCNSDYIISVTNTTKTDNRNSGAAWGLKTVDIGAPGTGILSTLPNDRIGPLTGTSMATPHIAGSVGLMHAAASKDFQTKYRANPAEAALMLKSAMLKTVDPIADLKDKTVSGGRLNLEKACTAMKGYRGFTGIRR